MIDAINSYNDELKSIANKILNLQLEINEFDIEGKKLWEIRKKLSVINNTKSRKIMENKLNSILKEYTLMLAELQEKSYMEQRMKNEEGKYKDSKECMKVL